MRPDAPRPPVAGPDAGPDPPFPLRVNGTVVKGFGRGSKELGIPTANIPVEGLAVGGHEDVESGVYFGWAGLDVNEQGKRATCVQPLHDQDAETSMSTTTSVSSTLSSSSPNQSSSNTYPPAAASSMHIYPMVMSIGWNPFYKNSVRSVEVHILHDFACDFYGAHMNLLILGFIRPEYDYVDKKSLAEDIRVDVEVARRSLQRETYESWRQDRYLLCRGESDESS